MILPKPQTTAKLFAVGATVGPIVDSIHNQCLLRYDIAPVSIPWPASANSAAASSVVAALATDDTSLSSSSYLFCSSWLIPPLLGIAYVVLGGIFPRVVRALLDATPITTEIAPPLSAESADPDSGAVDNSSTRRLLQTKGLLAVTSTAAIIKLSEYLQTHPGFLGLGSACDSPSPEANLIVMALAALMQWALLDGTAVSLLAAAITSIGGPLSELPFVAAGCWHYIPSAADYIPLADVTFPGAGNGIGSDAAARWLLGDNYRELALSSITGPCYFAVAMDSIALGRWFDFEPTSDRK